MDIQCPNCKQKYPFEESLIGDEVECAVCHTIFVAQKQVPIKLTMAFASQNQHRELSQIQSEEIEAKSEVISSSNHKSFAESNTSSKRAIKHSVYIGVFFVGTVIIGIIILLLLFNWNLIAASLGNVDAQYQRGVYCKNTIGNNNLWI